MLPQMRSNPIRVFLAAADRYGDLVHLKVGPYHLKVGPYHGYLLSSPAFWATKLEKRLPLPTNRRFRRALHELDTVVYRIIDERQRSGDDKPDLLSMFLSARDEEKGERMTDRQLCWAAVGGKARGLGVSFGA
jgi:cytochrome P450